ncbi:4,5-dihydroxyphthalate decarboxylase [Paenibacillus sp. MWE-103]|uniref:4,5-dihydroxyphthalate decarboxylase n=1 Tax=Paenibacillus artemisiicola TaxID=1172618 RepID=A0ABS3WFS5_9BACL|nr:4,5-dihydroxyphthalate decarboxylase [Paenibacillus artemisiicola]MBO7746966.1 4,5-dihydroxyphthalate decarboxylase [Paenibacillus artemisiicola]
MTEPVLTMAMSESDRTQKLLSGARRLPGFGLEARHETIEQIFIEQISNAAYDISELSLASYLIAKGGGDERLTAVPVFLSRAFRHNAIYVRADSPWRHPSELKGRRFGFPEYQMTAAVWVRGLFREEWGIGTDDMEWFTFRPERVPVDIPATLAEGDLFEALLEGRVDAVMSARRPPAKFFPASGDGGAIRRLMPDVWDEERAYYGRTGIFPIMHLVSLKADTVRRYPELPRQLYDLMLGVKNDGVAALLETIKNQTSDPWLWESVERSALLTDGDLWPYGVAANWPQIVKFMGYLRADGLLKRELALEEVFHPSVLHT